MVDSSRIYKPSQERGTPWLRVYAICSCFATLDFSTRMPRLTVLVSGCSVFLVAAWLLLGNYETGRTDRSRAPRQRPRAIERLPDNAISGNRELFIQQQGAASAARAKKKQAPRGVTVDRSNIIETVTMEDLRAPEGRLWIPASVAGPIDLKAPNPIFNVLVAYCQLDMVSYHESPWLFAMGTFHQRTSGCLDDKSLVKTFRLSSLKVSPRCCVS